MHFSAALLKIRCSFLAHGGLGKGRGLGIRLGTFFGFGLFASYTIERFRTEDLAKPLGYWPDIDIDLDMKG
jgi:hypothetical protein